MSGNVNNYFDYSSGIVGTGEPVCFMEYEGIGTCRAVWVPGQDLAMLDLMRNCVTTLYAVCLCMHKHAYA